MARDVARVWIEGGEDTQHLAAPPKDDVAQIWEGQTVCGRQGGLRWVTLENVDRARECDDCGSSTGGHAPKLEGDHWGPV